MKIRSNKVNIMVLTALILAIMSEVIFVLGAKTIWDKSIFVLILFAVIGLAKYQLVATAFSRKGSLISMGVVLIPLVSISFITHLSFFTDLSNKSDTIKQNISSELNTSNKVYSILNSQKQGLLLELKQLDDTLALIPTSYVSKRLKMVQLQKATRDTIRARVVDIDNKLLNQLNNNLQKTKANTETVKSSLTGLSQLLHVEKSKIIQTLNIMVAAIIDVFSLYMAYTVGRMQSENTVVRGKTINSLTEKPEEDVLPMKRKTIKRKQVKETSKPVKEKPIKKIRKPVKEKPIKKTSKNNPPLKEWSETLYTDGEKVKSNS